MLNRSIADSKERRNAGFSIIELMVSMALTMIILSVVARSTEIFGSAIRHTNQKESKSVNDGFSTIVINDIISSSGIAGRSDSFFIPCPGGECNGTGLAVRNSQVSGFITSGDGGYAVDIFFSSPSEHLPTLDRISMYTIDGTFRAYFDSYEHILCEGSKCTITFSSEVPADASIVEVNTTHVFIRCESDELRMYRTQVTGDPFVFDFSMWSPDQYTIVRKGLHSCSINYVSMDAGGNIENNAATSYSNGSMVKAAKIDMGIKKSDSGSGQDFQSLFFVRNLE